MRGGGGQKTTWEELVLSTVSIPGIELRLPSVLLFSTEPSPQLGALAYGYEGGWIYMRAEIRVWDDSGVRLGTERPIQTPFFPVTLVLSQISCHHIPS